MGGMVQDMQDWGDSLLGKPSSAQKAAQAKQQAAIDTPFADPNVGEMIQTGSTPVTGKPGLAKATYTQGPSQVQQDSSLINNLGQSQYNQTMAGIDTAGTAQTQRAKDLFGQMLPNIAENAQASHLYDSTGYGQEVGRQQANIASGVASQEAQQKLAALNPLQNMQQQALSRGFSLEDMVRQANMSKTLGFAATPQSSGKGNAGTGLQGMASLMAMMKGMGAAAAV